MQHRNQTFRALMLQDLAANDGDRAAWQERILPATEPRPDLDALNDSGGARFQ